jgi:murein DD-endopeptidase MepM/ murein hydrolase activator NlpD
MFSSFLLAALPIAVDRIPIGSPSGLGYSIPTMPQPPSRPIQTQSQQAFQTPWRSRSAAWVYPLAQRVAITSEFGWRIHPIHGDRRFHAGLDLAAPTGTPVLAASAARVKSAGTLGGYGLAVVLEHWDGTTNTLYGHLSKILVNAGQMVQPGQVIGQVGSTGRSTGPHLHFEVRRWEAGDWVAVDPSPMLP